MAEPETVETADGMGAINASITSPTPASNTGTAKPRPPAPSSQHLLTTDATRSHDHDHASPPSSFSSTPSAAILRPAPAVPDLFTSAPALQDALVTETTVAQDETVEECLPYLAGTRDGAPARFNAHGIPALASTAHARFLAAGLEDLPASYTALDAARPWMLYWALTGLALLGADVRGYGPRVVATLRSCQNAGGGFGGSHGHSSHVAPSYAAVLSLATVGGGRALAAVDRRALWRWLGALKRPDGGFAVAVGGEEDVR